MSDAKRITALIDEIQQESYRKGWDDATRSILAAAKELRGIGAPTVRPDSEVGVPEAPTGPPYKTPIIDMVYAIVQEMPGLRGSQIVDQIISRDPMISRKVADRTGRTSLSRLLKRDKIVRREQRWYASDKAGTKEGEPPVGSAALTEPKLSLS